MKIIIDGGAVSGPEMQIVERYQKRVRGPFGFELVALKKKAPAQLLATSPTVLLDEGGTQFNSHDFAAFIARYSPAQWVIGGSHGIVHSWSADHTLSLGKGTLPHRIAAAVLAEQLYRAYTINSGHPYHHA